MGASSPQGQSRSWLGSRCPSQQAVAGWSSHWRKPDAVQWSMLQHQTKPSRQHTVFHMQGKKKLYLPSVGQRNHVVNIDVASSSPGSAIIRGIPGARCRRASRVCHHARTVTLENSLTRVACSDVWVSYCRIMGKRLA